LVVHLVVIPRMVADQVNGDSRNGDGTLANVISQVMIFGWKAPSQYGAGQRIENAQLTDVSAITAARV